MGARGVGHEADTMYTVCSVGRVLVVCENKNDPKGLRENKGNHKKGTVLYMEGTGNKNYDVIIVGAGPGGIFSAYELMKKEPGAEARCV